MAKSVIPKPAAAPKSKALVTWEEEMAADALAAAETEANSGGGQFFSVRGGVLRWQDSPLANNQMGVIILDYLVENVYYAGKYDPDVSAPPVCFAFGRNESSMKPHASVVEAGSAQHANCLECPHNEWGSAHTGKGKACRNTRRLALLPAGQFDAAGKFQLINDLAHFESTPIGMLKLPVMSVKGYAVFVKALNGSLKRPPYGIATRVRVVPDDKSQFRVLFDPLMILPDKMREVVTRRRAEAEAIIDAPYRLSDNDDQAPAKKPNSRTAPAAKAGARKY